jgi:hypothetical protein
MYDCRVKSNCTKIYLLLPFGKILVIYRARASAGPGPVLISFF